MSLEPIRPLEYIMPHDPVPQRILDASRWFVVEVLELDFGDYVGRPSQHAIIRVQILSYLFSNGWYVDAVQGGGESGEWKSVSNTNTTQTPNITTTQTPNVTTTQTPSITTTQSPGITTTQSPNVKTKAKGKSSGSSSSDSKSTSGSSGYASSVVTGVARSSSEGKADATSKGNASSETEEETEQTGSTTTVQSGQTVTQQTGSTTTVQSGQTVTQQTGNTTTVQSGQTVTEQDGETSAPYWYAYVRIRLKRRKLQAELVMKDMVEDLTKAYNEGRKINDDRYDELVKLYAIMLGRTEDEGNGFMLETADFKPLTDYVLQTMKKTVADFHAVADNLPDEVFKNRVKEINLKFDNQLSTARVELITAGLFNSTVWTTTASGIERNREMALNDLIETKIDVYVKVAGAAGDIGTRFMDAAAKIQQMAKERLLDPADMRNTVFKWMLEFMERRKDEFPGIDQIAGAAKQLGYAETTTSNGVK